MSWLRELRTSLENPSTPLSFPAEWLLDLFNGGRTDSGIRVSELTALQVSTVFACVDIISGNLAKLPLNVYERLDDDATRIAKELDSHWLLHNEPNPEMTSFSFRKTLQCHALLWGNLYAEIERDAGNRPIALWPRWPHQTRPRRAAERFSYVAAWGERITIEPGEMFYSTTDGSGAPDPMHPGGSERPIHREDMIHIPGLSLDGRLGRSVVEMSRQVIGLSLALEKSAAKMFANGLRPTGVVELPAQMSPQAIENFKRSLQESYGGENTHRPLVIEDGMKWTEATIKPNEAQSIESRSFQRSELCGIFHVPPHMVGATEKTNRSNTEQLGIEFVQYTLGPWITPWEQELERKMFPARGRAAGKYFAGFDVEDMLLPDAESRGKYFSMLKQWGIGNTNDIRKKLRWNPIPGMAGTAYWMPVNMQDAAKPLTAGAAEGELPAAKPDPEAQRYAKAYQRLFQDAFRSISKRDQPDSDAFSRVFAPVLGAMAAGITMNSAPLLGVESSEVSDEVSDFIQEYCSGLHKRWGSTNAQRPTLDTEPLRAARALKIAVYRDLATQKAKQESDRQLQEQPNADETQA